MDEDAVEEIARLNQDHRCVWWSAPGIKFSNTPVPQTEDISYPQTNVVYDNYLLEPKITMELSSFLNATRLCRFPLGESLRPGAITHQRPIDPPLPA
jgi:hypothetical protein